jgi:acyl-coenzyme A thioesterase PaaI-like protein
MVKKNMDENISEYMNLIGPIEIKKIDELNYRFFSEVKNIHLNTGKMAHGGYLCTIADTGMGSVAHKVAGNRRCVTINLDMKFITAAQQSDKLLGEVVILKKKKYCGLSLWDLENSLIYLPNFLYSAHFALYSFG